MCGTERTAVLRPAVLVRPSLGDLIRDRTGSWSGEGWICEDELQKYRPKYVRSLLAASGEAMIK